MSIKGIDTQIMISRLPDNSKDTSAVQKKPEVWQDQLGQQSKINDAQMQSKVAKTSESEMEAIRPDVDEGGSGAGGYDGSQGSGRGEEDEKPKPGMLVPPDRHIIDITI